MFTVYDDTSLGAPALQRRDDSTVFLAWTGGGGLGHGAPDLHLNIGFNPGDPSLDRITLDDTSIAGPALTIFQGRLFLAWTGTDGNGHINVMSSTDGRTWENKVTLQELSMASPALTVFGGSLILAWTGTDGSGLLNLRSSTDGQNFGATQTLFTEHSIDAGPAVATLTSPNGGTTLHLVYTRRDNRRIHEVIFDQQAGFPHAIASQDLDGTSDAGPSLSGGFSLALGWAGQGVGRLNLSTRDAFEGFSLPRTFNATSPYAPATDFPAGLSPLIAFAGGGGLGGGTPNFQLNVATLDALQ